jgi:hypothetical protein
MSFAGETLAAKRVEERGSLIAIKISSTTGLRDGDFAARRVTRTEACGTTNAVSRLLVVAIRGVSQCSGNL